MKTTADRIEKNTVVLEIEVPQEKVAKALDNAYHKLANKVNIPGFRKGKAPRKVIESRIGKEALLDEAFEILAGVAYPEAIKEQQIEPVARPKIEVVTLAEDQPLVFKATVITKPEVKLGEYKGLKIEKKVDEVTDEKIVEDLENLRNRHAKMIVAEGAAIENGDFAIIDFEGFVNDVAFEGGAGKSYPLQIGSGSFIPGFEEQLIGAKSGEARDVKVTFPQDYQAADLAGKEAVFKVTINDVKRKELPALDDDFAKDASEFETIEELKVDIKNKLEKATEEKAEREFRNEAIKQAVEGSEIDVPAVMVESRIDNMINDLAINLENRGMKLEQYLAYAKMDADALRESYREAALVNVKTDLVLEEIVKAEKIEVSDEDMNAEVASMAQAYGAPVEEIEKIVRQQGHISALIESVLRKKAAQFIIDSVEKA
ncbi:Trigger factor [bioreactor metagenome]|uniref:peptidylprolyl isomerase n=1 Tax=bioreactor metagenome TaxID=1076179 RepID=A0A644TB92_9ZZZZ|nr:trigger factor [Negativicutes bacterium]